MLLLVLFRFINLPIHVPSGFTSPIPATLLLVSELEDLMVDRRDILRLRGNLERLIFTYGEHVGGDVIRFYGCGG